MVNESRRDPRYRAADANLINVKADRNSTDPPSSTSGILLDLSQGGLRLKVEDFVPKGEQIRLMIAADDVDLQIQSDAKVCWAEPDVREGWVIGCALSEWIDVDNIDELAAMGVLERRSESRQPMSFTAEAKTELAPDAETVQIVDLSDGGFCAVAKQMSVKADDRVLMRIKTESTPPEEKLIQAKVAWVNELEGGQTVGCTFLSKTDHAQMWAIANRITGRSSLFKKRQIATRWAFVTATVTLIVVLRLFWR